MAASSLSKDLIVGTIVKTRRALAPAMLAAALSFAAYAHAEEAEVTPEECTKAVAEAQEMVTRLSPKSMSRYVAERHLHTAHSEASSGEFDGCVEFAAKAVEEIETRATRLAPGETFRATTSTGYVELRGDDQGD